MAEEKKDLTGILQHAKTLEEKGEAPPVPEGAVMEEAPIEKIENFESLDDYAVSHPVPPAETPPESFSPEAEAASESGTPPVGEDSAFPTSDAPPTFEESPPSGQDPLAGLDFADTPAVDVTPPVDEPLGSGLEDFQTSPPTESVSEPSGLSAPPAAAAGTPPSSGGPSERPSTPNTTDFLAPSTGTLEKIHRFDEKTTTAKAAVPASFPFSLSITGALLPEEKEKLLDILSRENMGIREMDLEPQFEANRILIPRISEYAGILLIQALRGVRAQIKLGPSDQIFSTTDTREAASEQVSESAHPESAVVSDSEHPAERLPLTTEDHLPGAPPVVLIDTVTASASLKSATVEAESSYEYQQLLEDLQREIKYKAFRKGATAVLNFQVQMNSLSSPTHYRILVSGLAVKQEVTPAPNITDTDTLQL